MVVGQTHVVLGHLHLGPGAHARGEPQGPPVEGDGRQVLEDEAADDHGQQGGDQARLGGQPQHPGHGPGGALPPAVAHGLDQGRDEQDRQRVKQGDPDTARHRDGQAPALTAPEEHPHVVAVRPECPHDAPFPAAVAALCGPG